MARFVCILLNVCLLAQTALASQNPTETPPPTATPTTLPSTLGPGDGTPAPLLDPLGLVLTVMKRRRALDAPGEFKCLVGDDTYYRDLNTGLKDVFGIPRRNPSKGEKRWAVVGAVVGYSCAAIAAAEALDLVPGRKGEKKR